VNKRFEIEQSTSDQHKEPSSSFSLGARFDQQGNDVLLDSGSGDEDFVSTASWIRQKSVFSAAGSSRQNSTSATSHLILASDTNSEGVFDGNYSFSSDDPSLIPESDFMDTVPRSDSPVPCQSRLLDLHDDFLPDLVQTDSFYDLAAERDGVTSQPLSSGSSKFESCTNKEKINRSKSKKSQKKPTGKSSVSASSPNAGKIYLMKRKHSRSVSCSSAEKCNIVGDHYELEHSVNKRVIVDSELVPETDNVVPEDDQILQIKAVLPQVSEKLIKKKLRIYDGDVESAILALLEQGDNASSSNDFDVVDLT
jgi:hypothetical protein